MVKASSIKAGDWITFKAATRWNCGTVRRKVVRIGLNGEIEVRYGGWSNFVVRPREIKKVERKPAKIDAAKLSTLLMGSGGKGKFEYVIKDGHRHRYVGVGWVDEGVATTQDFFNYPEVS